MTDNALENIGLVAIGRNEGDRLKRCLRSVMGTVPHLVYVDSGSSDDSVSFAQSIGADVVELDMSIPFTMARGRNEGFAHLMRLHPNLSYVQFVDGDCKVEEGWIEHALSALEGHPEVAAVSGRRREQFPENSIYNRLADMEWNLFTPGEVAYCGGDAMIRVDAFEEVEGYNISMIAGEEPEMCFRMRQAGWKIRRVDQAMTRHDAALTRFGQWWTRCARGGHAYAEFSDMHKNSPERPKRREARRAWIYGLVIPLVSVGMAWPSAGWSLLLMLLYPVSAFRACRPVRKAGYSVADTSLYGAHCTLSKFPEALGQVRYYLRRRSGKPPELMEYK
jgi:GT2 family glycosyltransferase